MTEMLKFKLVYLKDILSMDRTANYVYQINCNDCSSVHVGRTDRELKVRLSEHRRLSKITVGSQQNESTYS